MSQGAPFFGYEIVAASSGLTVLGGTGAKGDVLTRLIITVFNATNDAIAIKDGADTAHYITPANLPLGIYNIPFEAISQAGAWQISVGAGARVMALGTFSP